MIRFTVKRKGDVLYLSESRRWMRGQESLESGRRRFPQYHSPTSETPQTGQTALEREREREREGEGEREKESERKRERERERERERREKESERKREKERERKKEKERERDRQAVNLCISPHVFSLLCSAQRSSAL
jgi:hypothetical protein